MKKRYIVKRYGLLAITLLFLLIWLSQQNAADSRMQYAVLVEQQSAAVYDSPRRLGKDSQSLLHDRSPSKLILETELQSSHGSRNKTLLDSENIFDAGIKEIGRPKSLDLLNKSNAEYHTVLHEKRTRNDYVNVLHEYRKQPSANDLTELDSKSSGHITELRTSSEKNASRPNLRYRTVPVAVAAGNNGVDHKTVTRFPVSHISAEYRWTRTFRSVFNDSALSPHAEPQNVGESNNHDRSLNLIVPTFRPSVARRPVASNDDADGSLILARQMALRNFVKTDEEHRPHADQSDNSVKSRVNDVLSVKSQQQRPCQHKHVFEITDLNLSADNGRKQELDELQKFAGGLTLPEYDLPMLQKKNTPVVSTSTLRPIAVDETHLVKPAEREKLGGGVKLDDGEVLADTDDVMSSAVVLGDVNPNRTYAVFSTTTENRDALNFIFLLPLTALAWKRVGFDSIVIIVGPVDVWNSDELYHFVLSAVRQLDAVVVFLEPRPEKSVMISQVSRIFIANVLRARAAVANRQRPDVIDNTYLVTSDADIWPIYGDVYRLPAGRDILSLNSECCGAFSHRKVAYRMLPMANVGMRVGTWRRLTRRFGESPRSVDDILTAVVREFGPVALRPVHKGDNVGWFLDQMMVSLLVAEWTQRHGAGRVKLIPRDVGVDRLDRNAWGPGDSGGVADKIDAHLLGNAYLPGVWARIMPLVSQLYGFETDRYVWCTEYYDSFQKLFVAKYRLQNGVGGR